MPEGQRNRRPFARTPQARHTPDVAGLTYARKRATPMPVAVVVWSLPNCVQCVSTKRQLDKHGIPYIERDLTEHIEQAAKFRDAGYATAPVVVTSRGTWAGFRPELIKELKEHA